MIGGRLRVLSYVNWPYGHGVPYDDILARAHDIDRAYNGTETDLREVVGTYNVKYVYVGGEEESNYPDCVSRFSSVDWLKPVYSQGNLLVYEVTPPQNSSLSCSQKLNCVWLGQLSECKTDFKRNLLFQDYMN
jgi:uncharacterized membrane protein